MNQPSTKSVSPAPAPTVSHDPYSTSAQIVDPRDGSTASYHPEEGTGVMLGPYKLLHPLGRGGMGAVWLAEQREPVQRQVAVKIIKSSLSGDQVIARFEAERQALALMDHPNIAKVLDAGATQAGRPFFVMELVKGVPFTTYCDQEKLPLADRLTLFMQVCQAVQHAHQKGIIHRDLKPSNVLVALYDGKPVPKVIDFGLAKATAQKLTDKTMYTEVGQLVGTLEYMAPEQAVLNNLDVDTRADIYSLGVMLYELLAGSTPFTPRELRQVPYSEMLRVIRDVEPPKPSSRLTSAADLAIIATRRQSSGAKLPRIVEGDLDWIVMKCLEKERTRRYESASQLADEVKRYLSDEPVQAGPPSLAYKARKFLRRNKAPVLAAAAVLGVLLVGILGTTLGLIGTSIGLFTAFRARDAEAVQRKSAEENEKKANRAADEERQAKRRVEEAIRAGHRLIYAQDLNLAWKAWQDRRLADVSIILARQLPERTDGIDLRGWEWHYLKSQADASRATLEGHDKSVWCLAFSPDGSRLVSGAGTQGKGELKIWDVASAKVLHDLRDIKGPVTSIDVAPDGSYFLSAGALWQKSNFDGKEDVIALPKAARLSLPVSRDGRDFVNTDQAVIENLLMSAVEGELIKWDLRTGQRMQGIAQKPLKSFDHVMLTQRGKQAWTFSGDGLLRKWNPNQLALEGTLDEIRTPGPIAVSPDGALVAFTHQRNENTVTVRDDLAGRDLVTGKAAGKTVTKLGFSPDGTRLAVASQQRIDVWDIPNKRVLYFLVGHTQDVTDFVFSADGRRLASTDHAGMVKIWDLHSPIVDLSQRPVLKSKQNPLASGQMFWSRLVRSIHADVSVIECLAWSKDGALLATSGGQKIRLWNTSPSLDPLTLVGHQDHINQLAFSKSGKQLVTASDDQSLRVWDLANGTTQFTLSGHTKWVYGVAVDPKGKFILSTANEGDEEVDGELKLWNLTTGECMKTLNGIIGNPVAFSPTQDIAASVGDSWEERDAGQQTPKTLHQVKLWSTTTTKTLTTLKGHTGPVYAIAFSADGKHVATGSADKTARIWDAQTGACLHTLGGFDDSILCVKFSPTSAVLATGAHDKGLKIFNADTGAELHALKGHAEAIIDLDFSPDGKRLLSAGGLGKAFKLWDTTSGLEVFSFTEPTARPAHAAFAPDGNRIATVANGVVKIWTAPR